MQGVTLIFVTKVPLGEEGLGWRDRPDQGLAFFMTEVLRKGSCAGVLVSLRKRLHGSGRGTPSGGVPRPWGWEELGG